MKKSANLQIEWAFGYRGHQCRNNLHYNKNDETVYFVAGIGVVFNTKEKKQRFFKGHSDDLLW